MKKLFSIIFLILFFIFGQQNLYGQNKDTTGQAHQKDSINQKNDSLNTIILQKFNKKQEELEKLRIADSITKARLVAEISSLQTTDNFKKQDLEKQLQEIRNKEAVRFSEKKKQIDSLRLTAKGYPVLGFFNDTLFFIYNKSGSFSAEERANAIIRRIKKLSDNFNFTPDSIHVIPTEVTTDLVFRDHILISISDNDALWNNATRENLAGNYRQIIGNEVLQYKHATTFSTLAKEVGLALLVILIVILLIKYIGKSFRWTREKIREQKDKFIKGIRIRNYTLLDAGKEVNALLKVNTVIKWLVILLVIYIALPIVFGIFPWTNGFASTLFGYILNPLKGIGNAFLNFLPNLITIIVIVIVFRYIIRGIRYLKDEIRNGQLRIPGFFPDWANPTCQIVRVLIYAFMLAPHYRAARDGSTTTIPEQYMPEDYKAPGFNINLNDDKKS